MVVTSEVAAAVGSISINRGCRNGVERVRLSPIRKKNKKKKKNRLLCLSPMINNKKRLFFSSIWFSANHNTRSNNKSKMPRRIINKRQSASSTYKGRRNVKNKRQSASLTYKGRRNVLSVCNLKKVRFNDELTDMRKLSSNDEAFHLSPETIREIIDIIHSRKMPTPNTYRQWDDYARSFYLKMCTCFGVDYQNLENGKSPLSYSEEDLERYSYVGFDLKTPSDTDGMSGKECLKKVTGVGFVLRAQPSTDEMSYEERLEGVEVLEGVEENDTECGRLEYDGLIELSTIMSYEEYEEYASEVLISVPLNGRRMTLEAAFDFGYYSSQTEPDRIPYHLYLLIKEVVAIIDNTNDPADLKVVEEKICFFMTYFHSHLTARFSYHRDKARSLIANYDSMRKPRYKMDGYNLYPYVGFVETVGWDPRTCMSPQEMIDVMSIIHLRQTPIFWGMSWDQISFYCKLCSCFGIEYHNLEAASEDDVCLMNTRRNG